MNKIARVAALCAVGGLLLTAIVTSTSNKVNPSEQIWDTRTTIGNVDAKNYYVMYTDLMCPYCDILTRELIENEDDFNKFIADNNILFEVRVTDMLYDSVGSDYSRQSATATYCAKNEDKFFDYYHAAVMALYNDYHSKGIGDSKTSPAITNLPEDYWVKIGENIGLGENFANCYYNNDTLDEVIENTTKAEHSAEGLPYFVLNSEKISGYSSDWGWEALFSAGLGK